MFVFRNLVRHSNFIQKVEIIHNIHNITIWYIKEGHGVGIYILLEIIHESHAKDTDFQNKSKWLSKFPIKRKVIRIGSNFYTAHLRELGTYSS